MLLFGCIGDYQDSSGCEVDADCVSVFYVDDNFGHCENKGYVESGGGSGEQVDVIVGSYECGCFPAPQENYPGEKWCNPVLEDNNIYYE